MALRSATAIVTARNEADRIADTVQGLHRIPEIGSVVVIDDGSEDATGDEAAAAGATVLRQRRVGKGGALEAALDRVDRSDAYLLADGDLGASAAGLRPLLRPVLEAEADLAVGIPPIPPTGGFGIVKSLSGRLVESLAGRRPVAPLSGQRGVTRECLWSCRPVARGFGLESAMTADALRLGFRVQEVEIHVEHRFGRKDLTGFVHRGRQGAHIARALLPRLAGLR